MKKAFAVAMAVLFVLSLSSVAFAAVGSPVVAPVEVKTETGKKVETISAPLSEAQQAAIKKAVAEMKDSGLKKGEELGDVVAAVTLVVSGNPEDAGKVGMNVAAELNGKTVAAIVKLPDGTVKVLRVKVKNGTVEIPWDAAWGKKADIVVAKIA